MSIEPSKALVNSKDRIVVTSDEDNVVDINWNTVEWETAVDRLGEQIVFEKLGDQFLGMFTGHRIVETDDGPFNVLTFKGRDGLPYQINAGWKLEQAFLSSDIKRGDIVCIEYVNDVDTGQPSPLKDFKVYRAKRP